MKSEYTGIHFYLFLLVLKILKLNNMLIQKKKQKKIQYTPAKQLKFILISRHSKSV